MGLPSWAPLKVYARSPFARIDTAGMYDYATGKYSPVLFHNYVTGQDITHAPPTPTVLIHEGDKSTLSGMGRRHLPAVRPQGTRTAEVAKRRGSVAATAAEASPTPDTR